MSGWMVNGYEWFHEQISKNIAFCTSIFGEQIVHFNIFFCVIAFLE